MNITRAWEASMTARWHTHSRMSRSHDLVAAHQGRVALLALMLWPTRHALHRAAILHDMGEAAVADVAAHVKERNPVLKAELDRLEAEAIADMGLPDVDLDDTEREMLRLCDRLDAYLCARHHAPDLMKRSDWKADREWIVRRMWRHGLGHHVRSLMEG